PCKRAAVSAWSRQHAHPAALGEELADDVGADEARATGHERVSHCTGGRGAATLRGWPETRRDPAPLRMALFIPPAAGPPHSVGGLRRGAIRLRCSMALFIPPAAGPPHSVGGLRRGAIRLRCEWRSSFQRPRGRHTPWVA